MTMLTIGEVARRAGVRTSALRYYEEVGVLPPAERHGGQRRYDEAVLARLAVVRLAQEVGFSVAEMRALVEGFDHVGVAAERWRVLASRKLTEVDVLIARVENMKQVLEKSLRCGCLTLDSCVLVLDTQVAWRWPRFCPTPSQELASVFHIDWSSPVPHERPTATSPRLALIRVRIRRYALDRVASSPLAWHDLYTRGGAWYGAPTL